MTSYSTIGLHYSYTTVTIQARIIPDSHKIAGHVILLGHSSSSHGGIKIQCVFLPCFRGDEHRVEKLLRLANQRSCIIVINSNSFGIDKPSGSVRSPRGITRGNPAEVIISKQREFLSRYTRVSIERDGETASRGSTGKQRRRAPFPELITRLLPSGGGGPAGDGTDGPGGDRGGPFLLARG